MRLGFDVHAGVRRLLVGLGLAALPALVGAGPRAAAQDLPNFSQYKRVHQKALAWWEAGRLEDAARGLAQTAEQQPDDAETRLWQAIIAAEQGQAEPALAHLEEALRLGLPPERCVLGTEAGLAALHALPEWPRFRSRLPALLFHGPTLGAREPDSVRVWLRTEGSVEVSAWARAVGEDDGARIECAPRRTEESADFAITLELSGLSPGRRYEYGLRIGEVEHAAGQIPAVAERGAPAAFRVAFGGGSGYVPPNERAWDTLRAQSPDLLFLLGDNVYIDAPKSRAMQHYCYHRRQARPEFRRLVKDTPVYAIWDDHDFGTNDCVGGPTVDQPPWKPAVWEVFQRNWPNPDYAWGEGPGGWFDTWIGDVHFVFLDGRSYRVRKDLETPTMLGERQNRWLREVLDPSATFTVLISPVPWTFAAKGDSKDTWNGFREERDALFAALDRRDLEGVLLMSADRHRSDLWRIEREGSYDLYEFNSSRLTNQHVHPELEQAEFSYNDKQSFGLVEFDTTAEDPLVRYRILSIDGEEVFRFELPRSRLQARD